MSGAEGGPGPTTRTERRAVLGLCLLALVLRVIVALQYAQEHPLADRPVIDEASYLSWAHEIAAGDWLGDEVFFQEPLYPYWLATVIATSWGEAATMIRHTQAALGALLVFLVWGLARRVVGARAALVAAAGVALYRPLLLLPCLFLKPNLFLPILAGLAWVAVDLASTERGRASRWWLAGLLAGLGALLRGNVLILLPLLLAWPLVQAVARRRTKGPAVRATAWLVLGVATALGPVVARNHAVGGVLALTTSGAGTNVYGGNNPDNPYGVAKEFDWVRGIPQFEAADWEHEAERRSGRELSPTEVSRFWLTETLDSVLERPALHAGILWNKLRLSLGAYEVPDNHHLEWDARFVPLLRWPLPGFALWGTAALAGLGLLAVSARARGVLASRAGALTLALFFLAYLGTIVLTVTSMRARLALVPLLLPFGAWFLLRAVDAVRERRPAGVALAAFLAALVVGWPVFDAEQRAGDLAEREFNLLTYELREEGADEALLARVAELDERFPGSLRVWSLRAEVEFGLAREAASTGDRERSIELVRSARSRLETVVERAGENARERHHADVLLGDLATFAGVPTAARLHYERALAFDPTDARVRAGLAEALLALGAREEPVDRALLLAAVREFDRASAAGAPDSSRLHLGSANARFLLADLAVGDERRRWLRGAEADLLAARDAGGAAAVDELLERVRSALAGGG